MNNKNVGDACMTTALERPGTAAAPGRCHPMSPLTAAILAVLYPGALTLAQTSRAESLQLEEIVVTATRRDLNLQSVPQSVTAFSTSRNSVPVRKVTLVPFMRVRPSRACGAPVTTSRPAGTS